MGAARRATPRWPVAAALAAIAVVAPWTAAAEQPGGTRGSTHAGKGSGDSSGSGAEREAPLRKLLSLQPPAPDCPRGHWWRRKSSSAAFNETELALRNLEGIAEEEAEELVGNHSVSDWARWLHWHTDARKKGTARVAGKDGLGWPREHAAEEPDLAEERHRYMDEKLALDLEVISQFTVPKASALWPISQAQVAFLFMSIGPLDFESVWDRFFEGAPRSGYSIYIHRADKKSQSQPLPLMRWGAYDVPRVETGWCALLGVEVALLVEGLKDARNQQFVFLSHNTVPLKSYSYIQQELVHKSPETSKFCFAEPAWHKQATTETVRNELLRTCVFRDFIRAINPRTLKHHQWIVLSRDHAETVVKRAKEALLIWRDSWELAAPDILNMGEGCSDEAVPGTALLHDLKVTGRSTGNTWQDLTRIGVEQQCLTYVLWRHCFVDTEINYQEPLSRDLDIVRRHGKVNMLTDRDFDFFKSHLKRELNGYPTIFESLPMKYLVKICEQGFMFARKLAPNFRVKVKGRYVPLDVALPAIWSSINEEEASQKVWTRLSTEGAPRPI